MVLDEPDCIADRLEFSALRALSYWPIKELRAAWSVICCDLLMLERSELAAETWLIDEAPEALACMIEAWAEPTTLCAAARADRASPLRAAPTDART